MSRTARRPASARAPRPARSSLDARLRVIKTAADDLKAVDLCLLDLRGLTSFTDYFVIATGTSDRHVKSIADAIIEPLKKNKMTMLGVEGYENGKWVLIDLGDIVIHLFQAAEREYYQVEQIWADALRVDLA